MDPMIGILYLQSPCSFKQQRELNGLSWTFDVLSYTVIWHTSNARRTANDIQQRK